MAGGRRTTAIKVVINVVDAVQIQKRQRAPEMGRGARVRIGTDASVTANRVVERPLDKTTESVTKDTGPHTANRPLLHAATAKARRNSGRSTDDPRPTPAIDALRCTDPVVLRKVANKVRLSKALPNDLGRLRVTA